MQGLHTIDVAVIIAPVIFELITSVADTAEIDYKEGLQPSEENRLNDDSLIARAMSSPPEEKLMEKVMSEEGDRVREAVTATAATGLMSPPAQEDTIDLEEIE